MDDNSRKRIRNILSKCPRTQLTWSQLTNKHYSTNNEDNQTYDPNRVEKLRTLVKEFLEVNQLP